MAKDRPDADGRRLIPRPRVVSPAYLRDILDHYCATKWNPNVGAVTAISHWKAWPLVVRMPDVKTDFHLLIDDGLVRSVSEGLPERPRILCALQAETMQRIYYGETTAATESQAGRITVRGNETERRSLLVAFSHLTW